MPVRGPHGPGTHGLGPGGLGPHGLAPTVRAPMVLAPRVRVPTVPMVWAPAVQVPGKLRPEVGEAPAGFAEPFPPEHHFVQLSRKQLCPAARLCPRGKPVSAGEGLWGPREAARSRASPFPGAEAGGEPPGLQGVRGRRGSHRRGKPVGTDPWLPGHAWLCRPQPGPRELPSLCKVSVTRKRDFLTAQL